MTSEAIITPLKLTYNNVPGAGKQIQLTVNIEGDPTKWHTGEQCRDVLQSVSGDSENHGILPAYFSESFDSHGRKGSITTMLGTAPWVQFPAPEFNVMMDLLFSQMVEAWNEKHATTMKAEES